MSCTSTKNSERGSAIMLVVAIGTVVTFIAFTWVAFSVRRAHRAIEMREWLNARYAAESVVSKALYERMLNPAGAINPDSAVRVVKAGDSATVAAESTVVYRDTLHGGEATATLGDDGSYLRIQAVGTSGAARCAVDALFGLEFPADYKYALILSVQNKPLEIRRGKIIGDVKVAQQPLGPVEGSVEAGSIVTLPHVDESKLTAIMQTMEQKLAGSDSAETMFTTSQAFDERTPPRFRGRRTIVVNGHVLISGGSVKPLVIRDSGAIIAMGDIQVSGNVVIDGVTLVALGPIKCFDAARLDNVTLYTQRSIYLDNEVACSGNLYAYTTITLAGQSSVTPPAFAYVKGSISRDPKKSVFGLQLMQQSRFTGVFFCATANSYSVVERDARFIGLLYTRGRLGLAGTVFGCVAAFSLAESVENDRNVLAGGLINRKVLPKNFMVPPAFGTSKADYRLVQWDESNTGTRRVRDAGEEVRDE